MKAKSCISLGSMIELKGCLTRACRRAPNVGFVNSLKKKANGKKGNKDGIKFEVNLPVKSLLLVVRWSISLALLRKSCAIKTFHAGDANLRLFVVVDHFENRW